MKLNFGASVVVSPVKTEAGRGCFYLLLFLLMAVPSLLSADRGNAFSVVLWELPDEKLEFSYTLPGSKKLEPLEILEMERGTVHSVSSKEINIYAKGEDGGKKIATVALNPAYKASLILLKPLEEEGYEVIVLKDSPKSGPFGAYLFYNLSEMHVMGKLGEDEIDLAEKGKVLIRPKAKPRESLDFELWHTPDEKKVMLQRNTFGFNPNKYLIILLYSETSASGKVKLKSKGINLLKGAKE